MKWIAGVVLMLSACNVMADDEWLTLVCENSRDEGLYLENPRKAFTEVKKQIEGQCGKDFFKEYLERSYSNEPTKAPHLRDTPWALKRIEQLAIAAALVQDEENVVKLGLIGTHLCEV